MKWQSYFFILLLNCIFVDQSCAQLTVNVGYSSTMYKNSALSNAVRTFNNTEKDSLSQPFRTPSYLHGIVMGMRYKWDDIAIEGSYALRLNSNTAVIGDPDANAISQKLNMSYNVWSLGATGYFNDWLGLGTSFDLTTARVKSKWSNEKTSMNLLNQNGLSSTVYLVFDFPANKLLSISIKPFAQWPWTKTNLSKLSESLTKSSNQVETRWWTAGITLLFCNGKQE